MDYIFIYRQFEPTAIEYTFFSAFRGTLSKIYHILGRKTSLNKHKKAETVPCFISSHNGVKLDIKSKRNYKTHTDTWRLNNILLNDQWVIKENPGEILNIKSNENATYQNLCSASKAVLRVKFIAMIAYI
jgi:hypothetical protein